VVLPTSARARRSGQSFAGAGRFDDDETAWRRARVALELANKVRLIGEATVRGDRRES